MKKCFSLIILWMMPMLMFGQSYAALWKKVDEAGRRDLPKTETEVLRKIAAKAMAEKAYGQLLKAELREMQVMATIAPDSLKPAVVRMQDRCGKISDEVLKTVCQTVIYRVCRETPSLEITPVKPELTAELCRKLSRVKDAAYQPLVVKGIDATIFGNDLLNVIGHELGEQKMLCDYYQQAGNRRAACIMAAAAYQYASVEQLDTLLRVYGDLPEAGELAIARYRQLGSFHPAGDRIAYIHEALGKWGSWPRMNILRNEERELTNPQYEVSYGQRVVIPQRSQEVQLTQLRNLSSLTMKVYRVNVDGDTGLNPSSSKDYQKIRPLLSETGVQYERRYEGRQPYELFKDSFTLKGLPVGVYMLEFSTVPATEVVRRFYHVTNVYTLAEPLPEGQGVRYVVVGAESGRPIAGARLRVREYVSYDRYQTTGHVTDVNGEYILKSKAANRHRRVFAYTPTDRACPGLDGPNHYAYYENESQMKRTHVYTDRSIYRPGQTVRAAAIAYEVEDGVRQVASEGRRLTFSLRDANYKIVEEKQAQADAYGTCAVEFTLPSTGLAGEYRIQVDGEYSTFRVEEYKRPTFRVHFPEVKQAYAAGDTLTVEGVATGYAGVPVQGAKVSYKVVRRVAFWWWSYSRYWDAAVLDAGNEDTTVFSGEAQTGEDGLFSVQVPLAMPESAAPMFYHFVVTADVTDTAGETHAGQLSLPLGNRKTVLSVDLPEKVLTDESPAATFHLLNAAGKDLDAEVRYRIDGGAWQTVQTNTRWTIAAGQLQSGRHTLKAVCGADSVERPFVLFSLDDQTPPCETDDWFYQSAGQFPADGTPVTIQVGTSARDAHIVYTLFAGQKVIEMGAVDKTNELLNRKLTYRDEYGDGLLLTFAWVKNGKCYTHNATIRRPLPDKRLRLQWTTFRNRLTPGQQEQWTLTVKDADGHPVDAQLMATLYDQSLDQLRKHRWSLTPYLWLSLPNTSWDFASYYRESDSGSFNWKRLGVKELRFSRFDDDVFPSYPRIFPHSGLVRARGMAGGTLAVLESAPMAMAKMASNGDGVLAEDEVKTMDEMKTDVAEEPSPADDAVSGPQEEAVGVRENLNETAFFYPQLTTDEHGRVALRFTLPESLTTWRFLGIAHTRDLYYGSIDDEAVARKDVMIQPNVPRFLRTGDHGRITARIFNTGGKALKGSAVLRLSSPETGAVVYEQRRAVDLPAGGTVPVAFEYTPGGEQSLLVCQLTVAGEGFSDGEQHYLPILPHAERVTVTVPITQHHAGTETVSLDRLIPADGKNGKITLEYTANPAWLMVQALATVGSPLDDNAISQAASYYANGLGWHILRQNPQAKTAFELWKREQGEEPSLTSALAKNQELKDMLLEETPWVLDADSETEQKHRLADFFDENLMQSRLGDALAKLRKLQRGDGSWSWWEDMPGSFHMTVAVSEMLVRLNDMAGVQQGTQPLLTKAFGFMGSEVVKEVEWMKKREKEGERPSFPSFRMLQWLYLTVLDGRPLPKDVEAANSYLLELLKKDIRNQSLYEKALTAVILTKADARLAAEYVKSLKEYTVYHEETGRYYDTPRAAYSWFDYRIPTQTVAIEALQRITPSDRQTIEEMQRWLLQEKRTQAWDTPLNSVNAVYAFLKGNSLALQAPETTMAVDGRPLETPKATAAIGYVKTTVPVDGKTLTVTKASEGTSWGAVYAQFMQPTRTIADSGSGITVTRELLGEGRKVGNRVTVRITIMADRDYDFVQVIDKRAACLEPVRQLSGYHRGAYCVPKDYSTNYYYSLLPKGRHIIETEYYVDRAGIYETGTCTVQCAYAPEFRATTKSQTLTIQE